MEFSEGQMQRLHDEAGDLSDCLNDLSVHSLVVLSQGNASVYIPEHGVVLIKASGVVCEEAYFGSIVGVDLETGEPFSLHTGGQPAIPSTDVLAHLHIYREFGEHPEHPVRAIIHTHSVNATAIAANEVSILPITTGIADVFGEGVPCVSYARIGGVEIGQRVVECLQHRFVNGLLLAKHGVLTVGSDLEEAFNAAVLVENSAETYVKACALSSFWKHPLSSLLPEEVDRNHDRYMNNYGQGRSTL